MSVSIDQSRILNKIQERPLSDPHAAKTMKDLFKLGSVVTVLDTYPPPLNNNSKSVTQMSASLSKYCSECTRFF